MHEVPTTGHGEQHGGAGVEMRPANAARKPNLAAALLLTLPVLLATKGAGILCNHMFGRSANVMSCLAWTPPADPRGEKKTYVHILGGEKYLEKFQ